MPLESGIWKRLGRISSQENLSTLYSFSNKQPRNYSKVSWSSWVITLKKPITYQDRKEGRSSNVLGHNPEKTHNLPYLLTRIGTYGIDLEWFRETAEFLSYEYLAERYPGDFDPPPTDAEAANAADWVTKLFDQINP